MRGAGWQGGGVCVRRGAGWRGGGVCVRGGGRLAGWWSVREEGQAGGVVEYGRRQGSLSGRWSEGEAGWAGRLVERWGDTLGCSSLINAQFFL